jgi:hypothetical protein
MRCAATCPKQMLGIALRSAPWGLRAWTRKPPHTVGKLAAKGREDEWFDLQRLARTLIKVCADLSPDPRSMAASPSA